MINYTFPGTLHFLNVYSVLWHWKLLIYTQSHGTGIYTSGAIEMSQRLIGDTDLVMCVELSFENKTK